MTLIYNVVMIHNKGLNKELMIVSWITIFSDQDFKNSALIINNVLNEQAQNETFTTVDICRASIISCQMIEDIY